MSRVFIPLNLVASFFYQQTAKVLLTSNYLNDTITLDVPSEDSNQLNPNNFGRITFAGNLNEECYAIV
jgi:hypothetical protein